MSNNYVTIERIGLLFDLIHDIRSRVEANENSIRNLQFNSNTTSMFDFSLNQPSNTNNTRPYTPLRRRNYNLFSDRTPAPNTIPAPPIRTSRTDTIFNIFDTLLPLNPVQNNHLSIHHLNSNTTILSLDQSNENNEINENNENNEVEPCSICREPFESRCIIRKINSCGHAFHIGCIDTWFQNNYTCPICRVSVRTNTDETNNEEDTNNNQENNNEQFVV